MSDQDKDNSEFIQIPVEWDWNNELETIYVNHLRVTHSGPEFYIYFGELPFPANLSKEGAPKKLVIKTKVRLVISPDQMGNIVKALNENYEKFLNKKEKSS
mgnify:CR=1 FL=1